MPNMNDSILLSYSENQQVLNLLPVPVLVLKGDLFIIEFANDAMFDFWRRNRSVKTIGLPLTAAFPETDTSFLTQLKHVFETGESFKNEEILLALNDGSGKSYTMFIDYIYQPIFFENGKISGILVTAQDVTHKVSARKLLQETAEQLKNANHALACSNEECLMAIETAQLGTWKLSADRNELSFSKRSAEIYGLNESLASLSLILSLTREDYLESTRNALKGALDTGKPVDLEYPIKPENTTDERWVRLTGRVVTDLQGHPSMLSGTLMDITGQKMELIRKNDFIAMASHEFKTPLTSLKGLLQLLSKRTEFKTDGIVEDMMGMALSQVRKLTRMINSFVNISRLESGKFELELSSFDIGELVSELLDEVRVTAPRHQFIQEGCETLVIEADRNKIEVLLTNLIANAIKYTPTGKSITVSCFQEQDKAELRITDEGCGIAEKDKSQIFERFSRIENPHIKNSAGFGIGLFLCAQIVRYHHGEIWLEKNDATGCAFHIKIPVSTVG